MLPLGLWAAAAVLLLSEPIDVLFSAAKNCDLVAIAGQLMPIIMDDNLGTCRHEANLFLFPLSGVFSEDQVERFCQSSACQRLVERVVQADLPICTFTVSGGKTVNLKAVINKFAAKCLPPGQCDSDTE